MCLQDGTLKYITLIIVIILIDFFTPWFPSDATCNPASFHDHRLNLMSFWKACLNSSLNAV